MQLPTPSYEILSAMITPAIFLTADGSLIISTSNRMARTVDRIRQLNDLSDEICRGDSHMDYGLECLEHLQSQLDQLIWRSDRIRLALVMLYLAFGVFVATSLTLALDVWTGSNITALPTAFAVAGVGLMLGACINLVREALQSLWSSRQEISFYRDLHTRRKNDGRGCQGGG